MISFFTKKVADEIKASQEGHVVKWSQTYDIAPLRARLAGLAKDDPLYPLLLGFLDAQVVAQADGRVTPDTAVQVMGRMNMCADLKSDLRKLWQDAHQPPKASG